MLNFAGRECEGKHHRERGEALLRRLSPLSLRFSPSRSLFPYPLPSVAHRKPYCVWLRSVSERKFSYRAVIETSPEKECSVFCVLLASFSTGRIDLSEAANSGVYYVCWESFANRPRRKLPAGAARPEGIASGGSPRPFYHQYDWRCVLGRSDLC